MTAQHTPQLEPALVPELLVTSIARSIEFWCGLCGFDLRYSRPEERFAYVVLGSAHLMLEEVGAGRNWITAPLDPPLGRGVNFQIGVADAAATAAALTSRGVELFMEPETKWYRTGDSEAGVLQFLVTDPDGYLIRFQSPAGRRARRDTSKQPPPDAERVQSGSVPETALERLCP